MDRIQLALRRNKHLLVSGLFGCLLMGSTYALSDIRQVRYSNQARSVEFNEENWNVLPKQKAKKIDEVMREFADEVQPDDDYSMLSSIETKRT